jgi:hypothetical protein
VGHLQPRSRHPRARALALPLRSRRVGDAGRRNQADLGARARVRAGSGIYMDVPPSCHVTGAALGSKQRLSNPDSTSPPTATSDVIRPHVYVGP